jgi:GntR family transcriptional regulator, carbon starvation induced regulator
MLSRRKAKAKTLQEQVYQRVRADILAGKLRPGQRLKLAALRAEHRVSLSVVREALTRLAEQKLARLQPQQGFEVASLSVPDILDLTAVRIAIEGLALRRSIELGDVAWEARLVAANHVLGATPRDDVSDGTRRMSEAWAAAHASFHAALIDACGSPILRDICRSLYDASEFYRRWTYSETGFSRDVVVEHRALMEAALARDTERAVTLLSRHFENTTRTVLARLPSIPAAPARR